MNAPREAELALPAYLGVRLDQVCLVRGADDLALARRCLLAAEALGFDTESKPTFRKGEVSTGPHLIQLATDERVFLFQIGRSDLLAGVAECLGEALRSPHIVKAGFGLRDDLKRLRLKLGIETAKVVDLAVVLRKEARKDIGAKTAVAECFGQRLQKSKSISTSNWASPQLGERQVLYAADDAMVALRIYRHWLKHGASSRVLPASVHS